MRRIAVFAKKTTHHEGFGGMETQNKLLCEVLAQRGFEVHVFSPKWELALEQTAENGVDYHFVTSDYHYFLSKFKPNSWYNRSLESFRALHDKKPFDLIISQSSAAVSVIENKKLFEVKAIAISHGTAMGELRTYLLNHHAVRDVPKILLNVQYALRQFFSRQRQFVLGANKVIAVSNAVSKQLQDETFVPEDKVVVINNGIYAFEVPEVAPDPNNLVYVGQLTTDKGVQLFLQWASDARFAGIKLTVVGGGPLLAAFKQNAHQRSEGLQLEIAGKLNHDQTVKMLQKKSRSVFVFPTRRVEGFPMVLAEAMMAGMPVVAYDIGGVSDAVVNESTGFLIPFENAPLFAEKTLELVKNTDKMGIMGKNSLTKAQNLFTIDRMADKYLAVIEEVLRS
jgi:glycosyltransferase involved in cell wall biosynthesis